MLEVQGDVHLGAWRYRDTPGWAERSDILEWAIHCQAVEFYLWTRPSHVERDVVSVGSVMELCPRSLEKV